MHCGLAIVLPDGVGFDRVFSEVKRIMARWDENREVDPYLVEVDDVPQQLGNASIGFVPIEGDLTAMKRCYRTDDLYTLATKMQDWAGCGGAVLEGKLYQIRTNNPEGRWDGYEIMQLSDIDFPDGIGYVRDFPQREFCRALVLPDGQWIEREPRYQDRDKNWPSLSPVQWIPVFQRLIRQFPDNILVTLDTHY